MTLRNLERGIAAVQQGNLVEGARLIKIALRDEEIQGPVRSMALLWLAETVSNEEDKLEYYNKALAADPSNEHARQRINMLLGNNLPPTPSPPNQPPASMPGYPSGQAAYGGMQPPTNLPGTTGGQPHAQPATYGAQSQPMPAGSSGSNVVAILGGPNGRGVGFFVTREGLLATTRFITGGEEQLTVQFSPDYTRPARVVRSFPEFDLAFVYCEGTSTQPFTPFSQQVIPPNMPLISLNTNQQPTRGQIRATKSAIPQGWFPTTIDQVNVIGGNPILNEQNLLVGMLTRNAQRTSSYVFGLSAHTIYHLLDHYMQEVRSQAQGLVYCSACGSLSRAANVGGYYCEICGNLLLMAKQVQRQPQAHLADFYGDSRHRPCPNCQTRAGFYNDICLRCGYDLAQ